MRVGMFLVSWKLLLRTFQSNQSFKASDHKKKYLFYFERFVENKEQKVFHTDDVQRIK